METLIRAVARALGVKSIPEPMRMARGMTAEDFARAHGANEVWLRQWQSLFGKRIQELYIADYGRRPPQIAQVINGGERTVNIYPYGRQRCMFKAWQEFEPARELTP